VQKITKKRTILITGGAGFIGSHLIERLVENAGDDILSLDNYSSGSISNHIKGCRYISGDTHDIAKLIDIKPDAVFHLGEYSRVESSFQNVEMVLNSNIVGTLAVIEFCRKNSAKLIYAGSSTKFGDGGAGPNQSPYAWSKASNTELIKNYASWFGLSYAIAYFYNVYGPREISEGPYATIMGIFKRLYKEGKSLTVVAPGTQTRNFTHVEDIVAGLILIGEKGEGDGYGLGSREGYSIIEIAHMFGSKIKMLPERRGNRMTSDIDTGKTELLGWRATADVKDYIAEFLQTANKK
jgi:UDP-glucose 4-epimerase